MKKYLELAIDQFYEMKEEWLDDDRHCVGGTNKKDYQLDEVKFELEVNGFWEKADWFDYTVVDSDGIELDKGHWI